MGDDINATKMSDKALKMMGFTTEQQIDAFIKDPGGALPPKSWRIFWDVLKFKRNPAVTVVVSKLTDIFLKASNGEYKAKQSLQTLLNTIHFFSLWFQIDRTSDIKRLLGAWERFAEALSAKPALSGSADVLKLLQAKTDGGKEDILAMFAQWVHELMPPERLKTIQAQDVSTFDGMILPDGVHSSLYVYLKLMCQEKKNLDRFLGLLNGNLMKIKVNREVPAEAENSVMAILHILRSFVSYVMIH
jgi:hypothetical protein